jgi:tRNA dimethylallyltransferase
MPVPKGTLIAIGGPTASGKTALAVSLAKHFGAEVVNADARQFYHALRIGAALPTEEEMDGVPHHFVGHLPVEHTMSAGAFEKAAVPLLQELLAARGTAILVGGSGLYLRAVLNGLDELPLANEELRAVLNERLRTQGLASLLRELERLDPESHARVDPHNPARVLRALEVCLATGKPYSAQRTRRHAERPWRTVAIALELPRQDLYARINQRTQRMLANGLLAEARALLPYRSYNALNTVGYKELFAHFDGVLPLDKAIEQIKQHTRNYAKHQITWLRSEAHWKWLSPKDLHAHIAYVETAE